MRLTASFLATGGSSNYLTKLHFSMIIQVFFIFHDFHAWNFFVDFPGFSGFPEPVGILINAVLESTKKGLSNLFTIHVYNTCLVNKLLKHQEKQLLLT